MVLPLEVLLCSALLSADEMPPPHIRKAFALLSYMGLGAIITLWITGIGLAHLIYGGLGINGAFHVKLLGAAIVLGISLWGNLHAMAQPKPATSKCRLDEETYHCARQPATCHRRGGCCLCVRTSSTGQSIEAI